jgi:hypothetical protein
MTDLYRFYDADDRLLYVGISLHAAQRASEHRRDKPWWPDVARMNVEHLDGDRKTAEAAERRAIVNERPLHNVTWNVATTNDSSGTPIEFDAICLLWREHDTLARAVDQIATRFDESEDEGIPSRVEFLGLIDAISRSIIYGDLCERCRDRGDLDLAVRYQAHYPIALKKDGPANAWCAYQCACGHTWKCGWTLDLKLLGVC